EANAVDGVIGDEAPWILSSAKGELAANGHLVIHVRGLVFPTAPNDEAQFRGAVTCHTQNVDHVVSTAVVKSEGFAATTSGDSDIDATLTLPSPCIAPAIFVLAGSEDKWFSVTGTD